jgi:hypothetical protein
MDVSRELLRSRCTFDRAKMAEYTPQAIYVGLRRWLRPFSHLRIGFLIEYKSFATSLHQPFPMISHWDRPKVWASQYGSKERANLDSRDQSTLAFCLGGDWPR